MTLYPERARGLRTLSIWTGFGRPTLHGTCGTTSCAGGMGVGGSEAKRGGATSRPSPSTPRHQSPSTPSTSRPPTTDPSPVRAQQHPRSSRVRWELCFQTVGCSCEGNRLRQTCCVRSLCFSRTMPAEGCFIRMCTRKSVVGTGAWF